MAELIRKEDTLNQGREKLNEAIVDAEKAKNDASTAKSTAEQALAQSESTQTQLDTIVIEGDSSVEAAQARVSAEGTTYGTLKQRLDTEHGELSSQLAQIENNTQSWLVNANQSIVSNVAKELPGSNINNNLKVFATLNGEHLNYVDNSEGVVRGNLTYENIGRNKGVFFNLDERITYDISNKDLSQGTLFLRFKPKIKFDDTLNTEYHLLGLFEGTGANGVYIKLNYLDNARFNGIETIIRQGSSFTRNSYNNFDLELDRIYTIAMTWKHDNPGEHGVMSIYLDGRIIRSTQFSELNIPLNVDSLVVGNSNTAGNRPAKSVIGEILYYDKWLPTSSILKMHRYQLDEQSLVNKRIYEPKLNYIGYKREEISMAVAEIDRSTGRLFGYRYVNDGQLLYSDDNGETHKLFHDFGYGKRIRMVYIDGENMFVSVDEKVYKGNKNSGNFTEVLEFSPGFRAVNGWGVTQKGELMFIAEYGRSTTEPQSDARLFRSIDRGNTWQPVFSLPEEADHIHAIKIDPFTGHLWLSYGDYISGTLYSTDKGDTWQYVYNNPNTTDSRTGLQVEEQVIDFIFTEELVIMASDKRISYCLLAVYDKTTGKWSRLVDVPQRYLSNVFAIHLDEQGLLWWYANLESSDDHRSSLWVSHDLGATGYMLEDLGLTRWGLGTRFVENENYLFIDYYRINKKVNIINN